MRLDDSVLDDSEKIILALRSLYLQYGYVRFRMEKFEEYDLYAQNKGFLLSENVITFTDTDGKLMALRPDVTLSVVKNLKDEPDALQKICYNGSVYRVSKGTGSFREIAQTGLECIGNVDTACIGETLLLAAKSLALCASSFVLEVSHLDILTAFVGAAVPDEGRRGDALQCVSEKNLAGVSGICASAGASEADAAALAELLRLYGPMERVLPRVRALCAGRGLDGALAELEAVFRVLADGGFADRVQLDFSAVSSMNYYNGVLFRGFVEGLPGSVLSGGQYDRLMRRMGKQSGAIGFAVYLDMLERLGGAENSGAVFDDA